jgi:hypothetical protein
MADSNFPFIVTELIMVLGGALAFGWWQLRDLKKERLKTEAKERHARDVEASQRESSKDRATKELL